MILLTALWIILGIAVFFAVILSFSLTVYVKITDEITVLVGAFGYKTSFDLSETKDKDKFKKKKNAKAKPAEEKKETEKKVPDEKSFSDTLSMAVNIFKSVVPNSMKMLTHLRIVKLKLLMTVTRGEADKTAIAYGLESAAIYTLLGVLDDNFKLKIKRVEIAPDFVNDKAKYDIFFKMKLRFCHILFALCGMLYKFLVNTLKSKKNAETNGKA